MKMLTANQNSSVFFKEFKHLKWQMTELSFSCVGVDANVVLFSVCNLTHFERPSVMIHLHVFDKE